jgi:hypothetical protein
MAIYLVRGILPYCFQPFTVGGVDRAAKIVLAVFSTAPTPVYQVRRIK